MGGKPRIYIAGPLGFSEAGRHFYTSVLVPFVSSLGYDVADPWTLTDARKIEAVQAMPEGPDRRDAWHGSTRRSAPTTAWRSTARGASSPSSTAPKSTAAPRR